MEIEFDEAKRRLTLEKRGLDFLEAHRVLEGRNITWQDDRADYGETRYLNYGFLDGRAVILTWTRRKDRIRIISLRKANDREQARVGRVLDRPG